MCGSLRVTKEQMRDFVLGKKIGKSGGPKEKTNEEAPSKASGDRKRPIDVDSYESDIEYPSKVAKSDGTKHDIIEPIQPKPKYSIPNNSESKRYIIYMAVRENDPTYLDGLSKCHAACSDEQVQSCLQFDGTRHITMFDGFLTNDQARNLSYKYNRFENGQFNPIKLKIDGWMAWDAGCYLKLKPNGERMLEAMLRKVDGFPDLIKQALQKNNLAKNGKFKFPCNHLSLYRNRPNMDSSKMKKSFESIRKTVANHDWGYVEGVSIRIKVMGEPYNDCKVIAGV